MSELLGLILNLISIVFMGGFFIIVVGTMIKTSMALMNLYMGYIIHHLLKGGNSDNAKWFALIVSIILAFLTMVILIFVLGKVIGNGVLVLFFLAGLYFLFRRYQQSKEHHKSM